MLCIFIVSSSNSLAVWSVKPVFLVLVVVVFPGLLPHV